MQPAYHRAMPNSRAPIPSPCHTQLPKTMQKKKKTEIKKPQLLIWETGGHTALQLETCLFRRHAQIFIYSLTISQMYPLGVDRTDPHSSNSPRVALTWKQASHL